ncbi:hypothetical protein D3C83_216550 [compost metagenome]
MKGIRFLPQGRVERHFGKFVLVADEFEIALFQHLAVFGPVTWQAASSYSIRGSRGMGGR